MAKQTSKKVDLKAEIDKSVKLFDVAKPGESAPSTTSRPIIVGHAKTLASDPMVKNDKEESPEKPLVAPKEKIIIKPPTEEPKEPTPEEPPVEPQPEQAEATPEPEKGDQPEEKKPDEDAAVVDAVVQEVTAKQEARKEEAEQAAKVEEVQKMIESKEFYVKVGQQSRKQSHRLLAVGMLLVIMIALASLNFALDAELLEIGIEPLTNLL